MFPELAGQLVAAEFGSYMAGFENAGRRLVAVVMDKQGEAWSGTVVPLVAPFPGRPLDVVEGPEGALYVADFESDTVWRLAR
jgi:glucose/arabinose dehydrogenase